MSDSETASAESAPTEAATADTAPADAKQPRKPFRKRFTENRLSPESAARQGRVTTLAWQKLGGLEGAADFLNNHDEALGGRPLDLAVASADGLAAVENAIAERSAARG
jgi:uncharacterized protein (DUF2384 family)